MITLFERSEIAPGTCLRVVERVDRSLAFAWHKHAEVELTLITRSSGRRFVGDHVGTYEPGDLVLLGPMLPHTWVSDGDADGAAAIVVQFGDELIAPWPEASALHELLRSASAGLRFSGPGLEPVVEQMLALVAASPMQRIVRVVDVLDRLSVDPAIERQTLARLDAVAAFDSSDARLEPVLGHIAAHFREGITQRECAALVGMTPSAFCRMFKKSMQRTFTQYVNELRVAEACRLLAAGERRVTAVAFDAGFENLSYFNRVFRRARGMSPSAYRDAWRRPAPVVEDDDLQRSA